METLNKQYVVEWSEKQGCFHINDFKGMIQTNLISYSLAESLDYIPLFFTDTYEKAQEFISGMKEIRNV